MYRRHFAALPLLTLVAVACSQSKIMLPTLDQAQSDPNSIAADAASPEKLVNVNLNEAFEAGVGVAEANRLAEAIARPANDGAQSATWYGAEDIGNRFPNGSGGTIPGGTGGTGIGGTRIGPNGELLGPSGEMLGPRGSTVNPNGQIIAPNGQVIGQLPGTGGGSGTQNNSPGPGLLPGSGVPGAGLPGGGLPGLGAPIQSGQPGPEMFPGTNFSPGGLVVIPNPFNNGQPGPEGLNSPGGSGGGSGGSLGSRIWGQLVGGGSPGGFFNGGSGKPNGEPFPGANGGTMGCVDLTIARRAAFGRHRRADFVLRKIDGDIPRLTGEIVGAAPVWQVRFHYGNILDHLAVDGQVNVNDIVQRGQACRQQFGSGASQCQWDNVMTPAERAKADALRATGAPYAAWDVPAAAMRVGSARGRQVLVLENEMLFPPRMQNLPDGRPIRFSVVAMNAQGVPQGAPCSFDLQWQSPIVLDLAGSGVLDSVHPLDSKVDFDTLARGSTLRTGWIKPSAGFLVLDLNRNGRIDDGSEMFGEGTRLADGTRAANGYEALAQYDGKRRGYLDARDPVFRDLKVWIDADIDGKTDVTELKSLASLGITRIDTAYKAAAAAPGAAADFSNLVKFEARFHGPARCGKAGCKTWDVYFGSIDKRVVGAR